MRAVGVEQVVQVVGLEQVGAADRDRVGGKAAGLGELIRTGFAVPPGFVVLTGTSSDEVAEAYRLLGEGPVAVRSSSTAEDLAEASFAGQYDTFLGVTGLPDVLSAIDRCRESLRADRAIRYRAANGIGEQEAEIAVIVQRMVDARSAGVLFTANPVTGSRRELVIEAAEGLGEAVVSGAVNPHRYVLPLTGSPTTGCPCASSAEEEGPLRPEQVEELRRVGERLAETFGAPQDAEWAFDQDGRLWLTQNRPITSLFPVPTQGRDLRAYWSVNVYQGLAQPFTPLGVEFMRERQHALEKSLTAYGFDPNLIEVDGWLYWDITEGLGDATKLAGQVAFADSVAAPSGQLIAEAARRPEFTPVPATTPARRRIRWDRIVPAVLFPRTASALVRRRADRIVHGFTGRVDATPAERLAFVESVYRAVCRIETNLPRGANQAGGLAQKHAERLLASVASTSEVGGVFRGVPGNPTSEMDLALWQLAKTTSTEPVLGELSAADLAREYRAGGLPAAVRTGVARFLVAYGCRVRGEIDFGVPRWIDDPEPVFSTLKDYRRSLATGYDAAEHFVQSVREADRCIEQLVGRLPATAIVRRVAARFLLRRSRLLRGLREVPKFALMRGYQQVRSQLLEVGRALVDLGTVERAGDVMFLQFAEIRAALSGTAQMELVNERRAAYQRECLRRRVPAVVLSDGTTVELPAAEETWSSPELGEGSNRRLCGTGGSPGVYTGLARVVLDPREARIEPGEILVCPSTDPGWTPLFLTAGALVTETGGMISHGTTVAREYGIPAVVGVTDATTRIATGDRITVDGMHGLVDPE